MENATFDIISIIVLLLIGIPDADIVTLTWKRKKYVIY